MRFVFPLECTFEISPVDIRFRKKSGSFFFFLVCAVNSNDIDQTAESDSEIRLFDFATCNIKKALHFAVWENDA